MKTLLSILILSVLTAAAGADEPNVDTTYFHPAASLYIHGDTSGASNLVANGLSIFPEDGKLLRLKDLLDQQEQQNDNQQDQDQDQQDQDQDQQDQDQDQQDQDQQDQDQQDQDQDQQDQDQPQDPQDQQPAPPNAEEMSADEAEQLLDAMRQEEQNKRLQLHPIMGTPVQVDKDW